MTLLTTVFCCLWVIAVTLAIIYILMQQDNHQHAILQQLKRNTETFGRIWTIKDKVTLVEQDAEEIGNRQEQLKERLAKLEKELSWLRTRKPDGF